MDVDAPTPPLPTAKPKPPPPPRQKTEDKPRWWADLYQADFLRILDTPTPDTIAREAAFIRDRLGVQAEGSVLDLACGTGAHAKTFARMGFKTVGLDLSLPMLELATADAQGLPVNFLHADMLEMSFEDVFDAAYCWNASFGFFDEAANLDVLRRVHRSLRRGGTFLLDVPNRDFHAGRTPNMAWFEGRECTCMDEATFDFFTSRLRVKRTLLLDGGSGREIECSLRLYTLGELGKLLQDIGFRVTDVSGHIAHPGAFFGCESPQIILRAEKRS